MAPTGRLRIGELSRRVGESPEVLRAWERRYGLVTPERTAGGLRLYSAEDERRVRVMRRHIDAGLSAAEAAVVAKRADQPDADSASSLAELDAALQRSLDALDEPGAQAALDRLLIAFGLRSALSRVILPLLQRLGNRWANAEVSVTSEHFASNVIGGRLRGLARGWGQGVGPHAVLACPPGELHELGLLSFGLVLREQGWRITYLGAETPLADITAALDDLAADIVVLAAVTAQGFTDHAGEVAALASRVRVGIGGAGASDGLATTLGVESLQGDLLDVAAALRP